MNDPYPRVFSATPSMSILVAGGHPWPALRLSINALHPQVRAVDGEIVVAVSDSQAVPLDAARLYPAVTWVQKPSASVFQLRGLGLSYCRGKIVAITEDHAWVESNWCRMVLDLHTQYPDAAAIGGVVENGATDSLRDWASFFIANGPFMRPISNGVSDAISLQANVSYKRRVLPTTLPELGLMQHTFHEELRARGEKLVADDRLVVYHLQALSLGRHSAGHYHNGRSIAGFRVQRMALWLRPVRALGCVVLPPVMLWRTLSAILGKRRHVRELITGLPWLVWFLCCHAAGELVGYLTGPGQSPQRVN